MEVQSNKKIYKIQHSFAIKLGFWDRWRLFCKKDVSCIVVIDVEATEPPVITKNDTKVYTKYFFPNGFINFLKRKK